MAARVDDAGLPQDGEHGGGQRYGLAGGDADGLQDLDEGAAGACRAAGRPGGGADDGEYGALDGLSDGLVCLLAAQLEGSRQTLTVKDGGVFQAGAEALEELREDDAAVAPGAHEGAAGHGGGDIGGGGAGYACGLLHDGLHGQVHVGAGVAVGDGEYVEGVDGVDVGGQQGRGLGEHGPEVCAADTVIYGQPSSPSNQGVVGDPSGAANHSTGAALRP